MSDPENMPHLAHQAQEIPGKPGVDAASPEEADATADELIRMLMVDQKRDINRGALPALEQGEGEVTAKPIRHPRRLFRKGAAKTGGKPARQRGIIGRKLREKLKRPVGDVLARVRNYRPTRKHVFFAVIAVIVCLRPWLIPITLFIAFWVFLIAYLTLGPDRVAELVVGGWRRLHARRPELAENIRKRAEAMAIRIDAVLDRLPGKWTDGLYVPDFSQPEHNAEERPDPFDRLAKEAQHS